MGIRQDARRLANELRDNEASSESENELLLRPALEFELNQSRTSENGDHHAWLDVEQDGVPEAMIVVKRFEAGFAVADAFRCEATLSTDMPRLREAVKAKMEASR